jgi:hypothetical protein
MSLLPLPKAGGAVELPKKMAGAAVEGAKAKPPEEEAGVELPNGVEVVGAVEPNVGAGVGVGAPKGEGAGVGVVAGGAPKGEGDGVDVVAGAPKGVAVGAVVEGVVPKGEDAAGVVEKGLVVVEGAEAGKRLDRAVEGVGVNEGSEGVVEAVAEPVAEDKLKRLEEGVDAVEADAVVEEAGVEPKKLTGVEEVVEGGGKMGDVEETGSVVEGIGFSSGLMLKGLLVGVVEAVKEGGTEEREPNKAGAAVVGREEVVEGVVAAVVAEAAGLVPKVEGVDPNVEVPNPNAAVGAAVTPNRFGDAADSVDPNLVSITAGVAVVGAGEVEVGIAGEEVEVVEEVVAAVEMVVGTEAESEVGGLPKGEVVDWPKGVVIGANEVEDAPNPNPADADVVEPKAAVTGAADEEIGDVSSVLGLSAPKAEVTTGHAGALVSSFVSFFVVSSSLSVTLLPKGGEIAENGETGISFFSASDFGLSDLAVFSEGDVANADVVEENADAPKAEGVEPNAEVEVEVEVEVVVGVEAEVEPKEGVEPKLKEVVTGTLVNEANAVSSEADADLLTGESFFVSKIAFASAFTSKMSGASLDLVSKDLIAANSGNFDSVVKSFFPSPVFGSKSDDNDSLGLVPNGFVEVVVSGNFASKGLDAVSGNLAVKMLIGGTAVNFDSAVFASGTFCSDFASDFGFATSSSSSCAARRLLSRPCSSLFSSFLSSFFSSFLSSLGMPNKGDGVDASKLNLVATGTKGAIGGGELREVVFAFVGEVVVFLG